MTETVSSGKTRTGLGPLPASAVQVPSVPLMMNMGLRPVTVYDPAATLAENLPFVPAVAVTSYRCVT